jgi:hypothetical protein
MVNPARLPKVEVNECYRDISTFDVGLIKLPRLGREYSLHQNQ